MKSTLFALGLIGSAALAGCSGGNSNAAAPVPSRVDPSPTSKPTAAPTSTPTAAPSATPPAPLQTVTFMGQLIFVTAAQQPVYVFSGDTANHSNCTGGCLAVWPAVPAPSGPLPAPFGSFKRSDNGAVQLSYKSAPLYTFVNDTTPDVPTGNGVDGFTLAVPAGAKATPTPTPTTSPTTSPTSAPTSTPTPTPNPYLRHVRR